MSAVKFRAVCSVQFSSWDSEAVFPGRAIFSQKQREANLNESAWRGVWDRTVELNQPARVQKELERMSLFSETCVIEILTYENANTECKRVIKLLKALELSVDEWIRDTIDIGSH